MATLSDPQLLLRKFVAPEIVFGVRARSLAGRSLRNLGVSHALLVSDRGVAAAGWTADVAACVAAAGVLVTEYLDVTPNPRAGEVMAGVDCYQSAGCDGIVCVGGGSVMDCGKGIGIVSANGGHVLDFVGADRIGVPMPPLVCVPTTGGSSSDVSQFAIITSPAERTKHAIVSKAAVPDLSLVDPETLTTMGHYLTACTGLDALVHAVEAFVSNGASPLTDSHALDAIALISAHLLPALAAPEDVTLRSQVMLASLKAGLAFSNASLGAVHAMAHSLGGRLDLAHGECNAILLPHVAAFNYAAAPERHDRIAAALGVRLEGRSVRERQSDLVAVLEGLRSAAGIAPSLHDRGVRRGDVPDLAVNAFNDVCLVTNPRRATRRDLEVVYEEAL